MDIRPIKPTEIDAAKLLVPAGYAEPDWNRCFVMTEGDEIFGLMGVETQLILEPLYIKPSVAHKRSIVTKALFWADGFLRMMAAGTGVTGWRAFIADENSKFQEFVKATMPVTWDRERPGLWFHRDYRS
jgi:hypothetical protein